MLFCQLASPQCMSFLFQKFDSPFSATVRIISYSGTFLQVDLAHLLAARDQELRALSAEVIHCGLTECNSFNFCQWT